MNAEIAFIENQKNWYEFFKLPFGAKQEEIYADVYRDKKSKKKNSAARYSVAEDIRNFRKKN